MKFKTGEAKMEYLVKRIRSMQRRARRVVGK